MRDVWRSPSPSDCPCRLADAASPAPRSHRCKGSGAPHAALLGARANAGEHGADAVVAGLDKSPSHRAALARAGGRREPARRRGVGVGVGVGVGGVVGSASSTRATRARRAVARRAPRAHRHVLRSGGAPWVLLHREMIEFRLCPSPPMPPPVPEASPPSRRAAAAAAAAATSSAATQAAAGKAPLPPLDARQCDVIDLQLKATLGQRASFTILARDAFGRECPCARSAPFRIYPSTPPATSRPPSSATPPTELVGTSSRMCRTAAPACTCSL